MVFELPPLPYPRDALVPPISSETPDHHCGRHHQSDVKKLNKLVVNTKFDNKSLEAIITRAKRGVFNDAAQVWNHMFCWHSLSPQGGSAATGPDTSKIKDEINHALHRSSCAYDHVNVAAKDAEVHLTDQAGGLTGCAGVGINLARAFCGHRNEIEHHLRAQPHSWHLTPRLSCRCYVVD